MAEHFELEAKYESSLVGCQRLRSITSLHGFRLNRVDTFRQVDTYYDSADLDLRNQSASIRRRVRDRHIILTYKGPRLLDGRDAHVVKRREEESRLDGTDLENWEPGHRIVSELKPEPLRIVEGIVDVDQLRPLAEVVTVREQRTFTGAAGAAIEISIDHSAGVRPSDGRTISFDEIEVESKDVEERVFQSFLKDLESAIPELEPGGPSKLNRTLT